jgi:hypothetical protein
VADRKVIGKSARGIQVCFARVVAVNLRRKEFRDPPLTFRRRRIERGRRTLVGRRKDEICHLSLNTEILPRQAHHRYRPRHQEFQCLLKSLLTAARLCWLGKTIENKKVSISLGFFQVVNDHRAYKDLGF